MRELVPACPPGALDSIITTFRPSDAAYTAAPSPAGPAPIITTSLIAVRSMVGFRPRQSATCWVVGLRRTMLPRQITTGMSAALTRN